jgi:hypothetical protein
MGAPRGEVERGEEKGGTWEREVAGGDVTIGDRRRERARLTIISIR